MKTSNLFCNARILPMASDYSSLKCGDLRKARQLLRSTAERAEAEAVVLDFANTEYFGASFVRALEDFADMLDERDIKLALSGLSEDCANVLRLASPNRRWTFYSSTSSAVRRLLQPCRPCFPVSL